MAHDSKGRGADNGNWRYRQPGVTAVAGFSQGCCQYQERLWLMIAVDYFATKDIYLRGSLSRDEPMAAHTSWKVGGVADIYYQPADKEDLREFLRHLPQDTAVTVIGRGSNLLVRDGGIRGVVVQTTNCLDGIKLDGDTVWAESGVPCSRLARFCAMAGFTGIEFMSGIPGTVGGALAMNAGAYGTETWEHVIMAELVDVHGNVRQCSRSDFEVSYRQVSLDHGQWFIAANMRLCADDPVACRARIKELLQRRGSEQPVTEYSCGSVFRNPPGHKAAALIDGCGLRGTSIGNASVSDKHANFIVHDGDASAADIEGLITHVARVVQDATGIVLQPEVKIIGEAAGDQACAGGGSP